MYNHEPAGYVCPFCDIVGGLEHPSAGSARSDLVYHDRYISAVVSLQQWPHNRGHAVLFPNLHYENVYNLPLHFATRIHDLARGVALALKRAYACDGTSTRQHNEPAGGQDVWHYHLHVFPRYVDDNLYGSVREPVPFEQRVAQASLLRAALADWRPDASIMDEYRP